MATFFPLLAVVLLAGWVFAEFKAGKGVRLAMGLACMGSLALTMTLGNVESAVVSAKTAMHYNRSLHLISDLIEHEHAKDIPPAIARYEASVSATQSHLLAAITLKEELAEVYRTYADKQSSPTPAPTGDQETQDGPG